MVTAGPVSPNDFRCESATAAFDLYEIADDGNRTIEAVLVPTKLAFGNNLARFKHDPFYPVAHFESITLPLGALQG